MISLLFSTMLQPLFAQEKSAFEQALSHESRAKSRESWVEIKSVYFRRVEIDGEIFFLRYRKEDISTVDVYCEPPDNLKLMHETDVETMRRSPNYVQILHETCHVEKKHMIYRIPIDTQAGLEYMDPPKGDGKKAKP